jgi:hypothetical protein
VSPIAGAQRKEKNEQARRTSPTDDAERLLALFHQVDERGARRFSDDDIAQLLPLLLLSAAAEGLIRDLPDNAKEMLGTCAHQIGLGVGSTPEEIRATVARHYQNHPVNPALLIAFNNFVGGGADPKVAAPDAAGNKERALAFARFVGDKNASGPASLAETATPGAVKGGVRARLELNKKR